MTNTLNKNTAELDYERGMRRAICRWCILQNALVLEGSPAGLTMTDDTEIKAAGREDRQPRRVSLELISYFEGYPRHSQVREAVTFNYEMAEWRAWQDLQDMLGIELSFAIADRVSCALRDTGSPGISEIADTLGLRRYPGCDLAGEFIDICEKSGAWTIIGPMLEFAGVDMKALIASRKTGRLLSADRGVYIRIPNIPEADAADKGEIQPRMPEMLKMRDELRDVVICDMLTIDPTERTLYVHERPRLRERFIKEAKKRMRLMNPQQAALVEGRFITHTMDDIPRNPGGLTSLVLRRIQSVANELYYADPVNYEEARAVRITRDLIVGRLISFEKDLPDADKAIPDKRALELFEALWFDTLAQLSADDKTTLMSALNPSHNKYKGVLEKLRVIFVESRSSEAADEYLDKKPAMSKKLRDAVICEMLVIDPTDITLCIHMNPLLRKEFVKRAKKRMRLLNMQQAAYLENCFITNDAPGIPGNIAMTALRRIQSVASEIYYEQPENQQEANAVRITRNLVISRLRDFDKARAADCQVISDDRDLELLESLYLDTVAQLSEEERLTLYSLLEPDHAKYKAVLKRMLDIFDESRSSDAADEYVKPKRGKGK